MIDAEVSYQFNRVTAALIVSSPIWLLVAFGAFAAGSRKFSLRVLFALLAVEACAIGYNVWIVTRR